MATKRLMPGKAGAILRGSYLGPVIRLLQLGAHQSEIGVGIVGENVDRVATAMIDRIQAPWPADADQLRRFILSAVKQADFGGIEGNGIDQGKAARGGLPDFDKKGRVCLSVQDRPFALRCAQPMDACTPWPPRCIDFAIDDPAAVGGPHQSL